MTDISQLCILGDTIQPPVTTNPALGHLFRLRKIQSNIRRSLERSRWQFSDEKDGFNSSLKSALDIWRQDIPRYGTADVSCGYFHPNWMTKLYDYSILILMEEKRNFLDHEGIEDIFSAVAEVCMKYRNFQEEGHVLCFTWSAVSILFLFMWSFWISSLKVFLDIFLVICLEIILEFELTVTACVPIQGWHYASIPYLGHKAHE
jgi:hypothetical protein